MRTDFRVIIAGSRDFNDFSLMAEKIDALLSKKREIRDIVVLSGTARGADRLGERYAKERGYRIVRYPADWERDGNAAGPIRNAKMADNAHALIAFWDGKSRGTKDMIEQAKKRNLAIRVIDYRVEQLRRQTAQYAIEHITGKGMHTGIAWLQDSFNEYFDAAGTPGISRTPETELAHRQIFAQRVAIDCIHALDSEQLRRLDDVLQEVAKNPNLGRAKGLTI